MGQFLERVFQRFIERRLTFAGLQRDADRISDPAAIRRKRKLKFWALAIEIDDRDSIVRPNAQAVDANGTFPESSVRALAEAGYLGLLSSPDVGGQGGTLREAAETIEHLANACGSTAMVVLMHYAATATIEAHGPKEVRQAIGAGRHLSTLALSEAGSRSHFWAPLSTATLDPGGDTAVLDAAKSWVTAGAEAKLHGVRWRAHNAA